LTHPLTKSKLLTRFIIINIKDTLKNWGAEGSALFHKNKVVLTPESYDKSGLIFNKKVENN
jgi:hypothetical protein